jgi:hypothetical protein
VFALLVLLRAPSCSPSLTPTESYVARVYTRAANGSPRSIDVSASDNGAQRRGWTRQVSSSCLAQALRKAHEERALRLSASQPAPAHTPGLPHGGSARITGLEVALDEAPPGFVDWRQLQLIRQLVAIGRLEGFDVTVHVAAGREAVLAEAERISGVNVLESPGPADIWIEDIGEIERDGNVSFPALVGDPDRIASAVFRARLARFHPDIPAPSGLAFAELRRWLEHAYPDIGFEVLGRVDKLGSQTELAASALDRHAEVREDLTYLEGGNHLLGLLPDGTTYAVVGRDSVAASRAVLSLSLGREVPEGDVSAAIAADLGVEEKDLYPVEQPAAFHLDMSLMLVGPKVAVLDDAEEAARLQEQWMREAFAHGDDDEIADTGALEARVRRLWAQARRRAALEERTRADLAASGFAVHRMAGVFDEWPSQMNVMNVIVGTNGAGERYAISLGADPRAEQYAASKLLGELPIRLDRIYFLARELSLPVGPGGIKCRVKTTGSLVSQSQRPESL